MHEVVPPKIRPISRAKVLMDGIAYGRRYDPPRPLPRQPLVTSSMQHARKQLDAVRLRQPTRESFSWKNFRRFGHHSFRRVYVVLRRVIRRFGRLLPVFSGTPKRLLYTSLVGGVSFGMVSMGIIQNFATSDNVAASSAAFVENSVDDSEKAALKEELLAETEKYDPNDDLFLQFFSEASKDEYSEKIRELVKGYPIEDMLPYILEQDRIVAAFLIGIAKKESNWGKRIPVLAGQDCFNYWGYRGIRRLMGSGGHTCFNSRQDAVNTVAVRLEKLIHSENLNTPAKLVVWKCGYSCDGHSRESVRKWISDVDLYFSQLNEGS